MYWWLNLKLWSNANLYSDVPIPLYMRQNRARNAVIEKRYSRGCTLLYVDFRSNQWTITDHVSVGNE